MKSGSKVIVFDVCGTLYSSNTTFDFCFWREKNFLWKSIFYLLRSFPGKLINYLIKKKFGFELSRFLYLLSLKGVPKEQLFIEGEEFVESYLSECEIDFCHECLADALLNKSKVYFSSASIDPIIIPLSNKFGVDYFCSELRYDNDICSGKLDLDILGCKERLFSDVDLDVVITDNKSDLDLCRLAKERLIIVKDDKTKKYWLENISDGVDFYVL